MSHVAASPETSATHHWVLPGLDQKNVILKSLASFDVASLLNLALVLAACSSMFYYARTLIYGIARRLCLPSVQVEGLDPVYDYLMRWMITHQLKMTSKNITASAIPRSSEEDYKASPLFRNKDADLGDITPIRFSPTKQHIFWHRGNLFVFRQSAIKDAQASDILNIYNNIHLYCWSRTMGPIRDLLWEAQTEYLTANGSNTVMCRSTSSPGGQFRWAQTASRPTRALDTVIMDEKMKQGLVDDVREYLQPATRKWYASRGIPYRRGYLLSGGPGSGKSSLCAALAGAFCLPIYAASLADPRLTESELAGLFATLPMRCLVLLEDVDAAGLRRNPAAEPAEMGSGSTEEETEAEEDEDNEGPPSPARTNAGAPAPSPRRIRGLTLAGLLNVIDGVASHEGHVLVLTTNRPGALDPALVRPGRVDRHLRFPAKGAALADVRALFASMYRDGGADDDDGANDDRSGASEKQGGAASLAALADEFAAAVPPHRVSLAAVQGHLLGYKRDPRGAARAAPGWVASVLG